MEYQSRIGERRLRPAVEAAFLRIEIDTNHLDRQPAGLEFLVVVAVDDLVDCLARHPVQLELKNIDVFLCADVRVDSPFVRAGFRLDARAQQLEDNEEDGLVVFLVRNMHVI